jgi:hypothetical protein
METGARWTTYGLRRKSEFELDAVLCHAIEVRRYLKGLAVAATCVPTLLVAEKNDDVWFYGHGTFL